MADRVVKVTYRAETSQYAMNVERATRATIEFGRVITANSTDAHRALERMGQGARVGALALAAGLGLSAKAALDWESAWAGVVKTVDGSDAQLSSLHDGLREMARTLPATHGEIAAVAEAAGALGVETGAIEGFTRVMIDLGETTNLTADQAATAIAQIANIMGTASGDFDRMGAALVHLGNNGASTEAQIVEMAARIASAGNQIGLTEAEVLGFANALASVGIEAEAGGSAISRVMIEVRNAVMDGGSELETFAATAGMSASQFQQAFRDDAASAIIAFTEGLGRMEAAGQNSNAVLDELGLADIRVGNALRAAAASGDLFRESIELGNTAWAENSALADEAAKRYDTNAAKLEVARNNIVDAGIEIGGTLLPALAGAADGAATMARGFGELPGPLQAVGTGLALVSTGGLGFVSTLGFLLPKIHETQAALRNMGTAGTFVANNMGKFAGALGIAGVALAGVSMFVGLHAQEQAEAAALADEYTAAIQSQTGALRENVDAVSAKHFADSGLVDQVAAAGGDLAVFAGVIRDQTVDLESYGDAIAGLSGPYHTLEGALGDAGLASTDLGRELIRLAESEGLTRDELLGVIDLLGDLQTGFGAGTAEAAALAAAQEALGVSSEDAAAGHDTLTAALGQTEDQAKATEEALRSYIDAVRAQTDPLFGMVDALQGNQQAQRDYEQALRDVAVAEDALREAQASGDAAAAAEAQRDYEDALRAVEQANFDAAASAVDFESAQRELAAGLATENVSLGDAVRLLDQWVQQGLITAEQAQVVAGQFGEVAAAAEEAEGERVASIIARTEQAERDIDHLDLRLQQLTRPRTVNVSVAVQGAAAAAWSLRPFGAATGGMVPDLGFGSGDTVPALLTPGEFVLRKDAARALGPDLLGKLNRFDRFAVGGPVGAGHAFAANRAQMLGNISGTPVGQAVIAAAGDGDPSGDLRRVLDTYDELSEKLGVAAADALIWSTQSVEGFELAAEGALEFRQSLLDAAEAQQAWRDEEERRTGVMFEFGAISRDEWRAFWEERLAAAEEFSAEWAEAARHIADIDAEIAREQEEATERVRQAFEEEQRELQAQIDDLASLYVRAVEAHRRAVEDYAAAVDERRRRIVEETARFRDDIVGVFRSLVNPVDLFGGAQDVTAASLTAALEHRVEAARRFAEVFPRLVARGVDQSVLTQLAQRGPEGLSLAEALLDVDPALVNQAMSQTAAFGSSVADIALGWESAAIQQRVYAEVALPAQRDLNDLLADELRLRDEQAELQAEAEAWGRRMAGEVFPALTQSIGAAADEMGRLLSASALLPAPASAGTSTTTLNVNMPINGAQAPEAVGVAVQRALERFVGDYDRFARAGAG